MRLWSLHPRHLDVRGLVALWREALLAQAVLKGRTRGYTHHPQLLRFRETPHPTRVIASYLQVIHDEATSRGYHFDRRKIGRSTGGGARPPRIPVTQGQVRYEWKHLRLKLALRDPNWLEMIETKERRKDLNPVFRIVPGAVEAWEKR